LGESPADGTGGEANKPDVVAIKPAYPKKSRERTISKSSGERCWPRSFVIFPDVHIGTPIPASANPPPVAQGRYLDALLHRPPNGPLDANGKIIPEMLECRERGVLFDIGDGGLI